MKMLSRREYDRKQKKKEPEQPEKTSNEGQEGLHVDNRTPKGRGGNEKKEKSIEIQIIFHKSWNEDQSDVSLI